MPPRKSRRTTTDEPLARLPVVPAVGTSTPIAAPVPTETEERRERELEDLLQEIGTDGRIKVWHVVDGKSSYAGEMTLDGFTLDALIDTFGGGDKSLVFYQGRNKVETLRVSLDPSIPAKNPKGGKPGATPAPGMSGVADFASLIAAMAQSQMSSMQMMHTMMMQSQQTTSTMLQAMTSAMTARPERDPMDLVTKVLEVTKQNQPTAASELFSVFEKGMNVAAKLNGGEDDGTLALAKSGLEIVGKIVENNKPPIALAPGAPGAGRPVFPARNGSVHAGAGVNGVGGGGGAPGGERQPEGAAATSDVATSGGGMGDGMSQRAWVGAARPSMSLLTLAIGNVRPDTAADMIADRLSEEQFNDLVDDIEAGTPDEFLARFEAYFGLNIPNDDVREWMRQLVSSVLALVEDDEPLTDGGENNTGST